MAAFPIPKEAFARAYEATGLVPKQGIYHLSASPETNELACGCPLGAIIIAAGKHPDDFRNDRLMVLHKCGYDMSLDQLESFIYGVDGDRPSSPLVTDHETYDFGKEVYRDVMAPIIERMQATKAKGAT